MVQDGVLLPPARAAAVLPDGFLVRHADVDECGPGEDLLMKAFEGMGNAPLPPPGELDQRRLPGVIRRVACDLFPVLEIDPLEIQVPHEFVLEPVFLVGPEPRAAGPGEYVVGFKRFPHVEEIVKFLEIADAKSLEPRPRIAVLQEIDDLRFPGGGPACQYQDGEVALFHGMLRLSVKEPVR